MFRIVSIFFVLFLFFVHSTTAKATTIICWDGKLVISIDDCTEKPEPIVFLIRNSSTEGGRVSLIQENNKVFEYEAEFLGETGRITYTFAAPNELYSNQLRYNRPFTHPDYDFDKSESTVRVYYRSNEIDGEIFFKEKGEANLYVTCLHKAIIDHALNFKAVPTMNYSKVIACENKHRNSTK